jgi:gliding motility-associated-like protein
MLYQVCNLNCTDACNTGQVVFIVEEALDCEVPTVITPNGDGVNDVFFVPCLNVDAELDNEVSIFNQWGDEVFHAKPYDNLWEGTFNGEPLPAGTYFFMVKFNGNAGTKTGFLIIQR